MKVSFQGREVELRRLGLSDIFAVQRIVGDVLTGAEVRNLQLAADDDDFANQVLALLLAGGDFAEKSTTDWLKSLFVEPLPEDEEIYLPGLVELIDALSNHPDISAFLSQGEAVFKKLLRKVRETSKKEETAD